MNEYVGRDLEAMAKADNYHRWIVSIFLPYLAGRVAEVGAGSGNLSGILIESGVKDLTAFEPSSSMYALLKNQMDKYEECRPINDFFGYENPDKAKQYDTILYVNVLEHIDDDSGELIRARNMLAPGGYLLIFVPALRWLYGTHDKQVGHVRRYHKKELVRLVEDSGYDVLKVKYFDILGILPWFVMFRVIKKEMTRGSVNSYDKFITPIARGLETLFTPPLGKNIILIARKP